MIRGLLAAFDLTQGNLRFPGRVPQHFFKQFRTHKVGTAAGCQIASPGQKPHGLFVNILITADGILHRFAAFGKSGRIQDNKIIGMSMRRFQFIQ